MHKLATSKQLSSSLLPHFEGVQDPGGRVLVGVKASVSAAGLELGSRAPVPQVGHALSARVLARFGRLASRYCFGERLSEYSDADDFELAWRVGAG